jgi:hypothetical protein
MTGEKQITRHPFVAYNGPKVNPKNVERLKDRRRLKAPKSQRIGAGLLLASV